MWHITHISMIWSFYINSYFPVCRCICIKLNLIRSAFLKRKVRLYKLHTVIYSSLVFSLNSHCIAINRSCCLTLKRSNELPACLIGKILFYRKITIVDVVAVCIRFTKCNLFYRPLNILIVAVFFIYTHIINLIWIVIKTCLFIWVSYPASAYRKV